MKTFGLVAATAKKRCLTAREWAEMKQQNPLDIEKIQANR